jgi:hypothetical protein
MLSDHRLDADHPSKVLEVLSLAEKNSMPLILNYIRTAKPALLRPEDVDIYVIALAESSLMEAWQFQRSFPEGSIARTRFLTKIIDWCLSRKFCLLVCLSRSLTVLCSEATHHPSQAPAGFSFYPL